MTEPSAPMPGVPNAAPPAVAASPQAAAPVGIWERLKQHKVAQWTLAYAAAAYTLLHGVEMLSEAQDWPRVFVRVLSLVLVLGVPVVMTLAWYHGAKGLKRISGPELLIVALLLFLTGSVLWYQARSASSRAASVATARSTASTAPRASIAVVPFVNLTGDAGKEYFSDGMAEELINLLAGVPGLKVPARTSSFAYKGRNVDIRRIAQDLGVTTILEGSVRSAGERIRVTAQLVNAQTGYHIWSQNYDRQFGDVFELQDELAAAIVQALRMNLNADLPAAVSATAPTQDVEAYQFYLQAQSTYNGSEPGIRQAIALYDRALERDPKFARALAGRAFTRISSVILGYPLPHTLEDGERDAEQALALNPSLSQAHTTLGMANSLRGNWLKAEASFRLAIAADPSDAETRATYATAVLGSAGRLRQWHAEALKAYSLAPGNRYVVANLALADLAMGRDEDALRFAALSIELGEPPPLFNSVFYRDALHQGRYAEAADRAVELLPADSLSAGGAAVIRLAYAALVDPRKQPSARQAIQEFVQKFKPRDIVPDLIGVFAIPFTMLDAFDPAYRLADQLLDESARSGRIGVGLSHLWGPELRPFRKDPRFQALVTRCGLIDYWKQYGPPDECDLRDGVLTCR
jgi:TolB-like protein